MRTSIESSKDLAIVIELLLLLPGKKNLPE